MADYYDPVKHLGPAINHQKMYDFERDIIRAKNPLNQDFVFVYDLLPQPPIPKNGTKDMERYLFRRYVYSMMQHIFNQLTEARYIKAEDAFQRNHPDVIDDPYLLNEKIWLKLPRFDDPTFQRQVHDDCYMGVVTKFGSNRVIPNRPNPGQLDPNTPLYQHLINEDKMIIGGEDEMEAATEAPLQHPANEPLPVDVAEVTV